jgi:hypothetical protein
MQSDTDTTTASFVLAFVAPILGLAARDLYRALVRRLRRRASRDVRTAGTSTLTPSKGRPRRGQTR